MYRSPRSRTSPEGPPLVSLRPMPVPASEPDPRIKALPAAEIRQRFVDFFAERGHTVVPSASLVPAGDQTLLFANSGMVQFKDVADRGREALVHARRRLPALPARRRQAQRLRGGRADAAPPHLLRDARELELRRLLQARGHPLGVGAADPIDFGIPPERLAATTYTTDDVAFEVWRDEIGLPPERLVRWGDFPNGDEKNWWRMADVGPCGPCSRDPLRSRRPPSAKARSACPTIPRRARAGSRSGTSCSWSSSSSRIGSLTPLPAPGRRHGHGPRAAGERPPAGPDQLRHRPVRSDPRPDAGAARPRSRGVRGRALQLPGHRRPLAGRDVPHRRRRPAVATRAAATSCARILRRAVRHGRLLGRREPFLAETAAVVIDVDGATRTRT